MPDALVQLHKPRNWAAGHWAEELALVYLQNRLQQNSHLWVRHEVSLHMIGKVLCIACEQAG